MISPRPHRPASLILVVALPQKRAAAATASSEPGNKTALALVRGHDLIVHEDLKIANMTTRPKPRPDGDGGHHPDGAAAKKGWCARCGYTAAGNRAAQAEFRCLACGHHAHADVNTGWNSLRAGLALPMALRQPKNPLIQRTEESTSNILRAGLAFQKPWTN